MTYGWTLNPEKTEVVFLPTHSPDHPDVMLNGRRYRWTPALGYMLVRKESEIAPAWRPSARRAGLMEND